MFRQTGCAGVMPGRAMLRHPWLIREIWRDLRGEAATPPTPRERADFLFRHLDGHIGLYGEETATVLFRKWIPQYVRAMGLDRRRMVVLLQITELEALRDALRRLAEGDDGAADGPPVRP
jgi:tRNA-dihydrouridine synthase B